ncbi:MAG: glycosyltransferase [Clostridium baratii]
MKILYISEFFYEVNGANKLSMMHYNTLLEMFGEENVITVSLTGGQNIKNSNYINFQSYSSKIGKLLNFLQMNNSRINNYIIKEIGRIIETEKIETVFVDNSTYGKLVKYIKDKYKDLNVISFYHDIKRNLAKQWLNEFGFKFLPDYFVTIYNEWLNAKYSDKNITLNKRESELFFKYYKKNPDLELPIYMKESNKIKDISCNEKEFSILFVGAYYYPNVQGIKWFCKNVMSKLNQNYKLYIVGKGMEVLRSSLEGNNVNVVGEVEDLSYYYNFSNVVIAPIFDGAGMKVKTAEAFMFGKNFIGSSESLVGYLDNIDPAILNKKIYLANTADEYLNAIKYLFDNKSEYRNSEDIRNLYRNNYSDISAFNKLKTIINCN